jgi:hypothetical protein
MQRATQSAVRTTFTLYSNIFILNASKTLPLLRNRFTAVKYSTSNDKHTQTTTQIPITAQNDDKNAVESKEGQVEKIGKFKAFFKMYGIPGLITYWVIYFGAFGLLYFLLATSYVKAADIVLWIQKSGLDKWVDTTFLEDNKTTANLVLAWLLTELAKPVLLGAAVVIVPFVVKAIKRV